MNKYPRIFCEKKCIQKNVNSLNSFAKEILRNSSSSVFIQIESIRQILLLLFGKKMMLKINPRINHSSSYGCLVYHLFSWWCHWWWWLWLIGFSQGSLLMQSSEQTSEKYLSAFPISIANVSNDSMIMVRWKFGWFSFVTTHTIPERTKKSKKIKFINAWAVWCLSVMFFIVVVFWCSEKKMFLFFPISNLSQPNSIDPSIHQWPCNGFFDSIWFCAFPKNITIYWIRLWQFNQKRKEKKNHCQCQNNKPGKQTIKTRTKIQR